MTEAKSGYPVMYLVRDTHGNTLYTSRSRKGALAWGRSLNSKRSKSARERNPLSLVQSQFIGWIDELE
jgi:hypothetical protein